MIKSVLLAQLLNTTLLQYLWIISLDIFFRMKIATYRIGCSQEPAIRIALYFKITRINLERSSLF